MFLLCYFHNDGTDSYSVTVVAIDSCVPLQWQALYYRSLMMYVLPGLTVYKKISEWNSLWVGSRWWLKAAWLYGRNRHKYYHKDDQNLRRCDQIVTFNSARHPPATATPTVIGQMSGRRAKRAHWLSNSQRYILAGGCCLFTPLSTWPAHTDSLLGVTPILTLDAVTPGGIWVTRICLSSRASSVAPFQCSNTASIYGYVHWPKELDRQQYIYTWGIY